MPPANLTNLWDFGVEVARQAPALLMALACVLTVVSKLKALKSQVNGRLTELLEQTRLAAHTQGLLAGAEAARNEARPSAVPNPPAAPLVPEIPDPGPIVGGIADI